MLDGLWFTVVVLIGLQTKLHEANGMNSGTGNVGEIHVDIHQTASFVWNFAFSGEFVFMEMQKVTDENKLIHRIAFKYSGGEWTAYDPFKARVKIIAATRNQAKINISNINTDDAGRYRCVVTLRSGVQLEYVAKLVVKVTGPCAEGVCKNNGICRSMTVDTYFCVCPKGYSGRNCTVNYQPLGCFADYKSNRALPINFDSFRSSIDWNNMDKTVKKCSASALREGYEVFGVQYYGECWSGHNAVTSYNKHGPSSECWEGVGKATANYVYDNRITNNGH